MAPAVEGLGGASVGTCREATVTTRAAAQDPARRARATAAATHRPEDHPAGATAPAGAGAVDSPPAAAPAAAAPRQVATVTAATASTCVRAMPPRRPARPNAACRPIRRASTTRGRVCAAATWAPDQQPRPDRRV